MSGEKKAKGWRFYGLVGFGAIALLSAGVWALQYAGSGPEKTLSPLVVHNNLQIDLNEPDLFLDSDSLSQLPKDLLTIPPRCSERRFRFLLSESCRSSGH